MAASTVAIVAIVAAIIVALIALIYLLPLPSYVLPGGRRRFLYSEVRDTMCRWRSGPPPSPRLGTV